MKKVESKNVIICRERLSPYWIAQYTGPDGRRRRRSTKVPAEGGTYNGERLTRAQAKNRALLVAVQMAAETTEEYAEHDNTTVRALCESMLAGKLGRVSVATYTNARSAYRQFCDHLGSRADLPARLITRADVKGWVTAMRREVRAKTALKHLSAVRAAYAHAVDAELLDRNPCDGIKVPPDTREEIITHDAFTLDEMRLLIAKLPDEWSSAARCSFETYGQRLDDILTLRWEQFDWAAGVVRVTTQKTGRIMAQPMRPGFAAWARARYEAAQASGGDAAIWVHPTLHSHSNPSQEFTTLVRFHGIGVTGSAPGGRRRKWHSKTFHSIRRTVATSLSAANVAQGIAMGLVGHDSEAVHEVYIKPSTEQLRAAASALPEI